MVYAGLDASSPLRPGPVPTPELEFHSPAEQAPPVSHSAYPLLLCGGPAITAACQNVSPMLLLRDSSWHPNAFSLLVGAPGWPAFTCTVLQMHLLFVFNTLGIQPTPTCTLSCAHLTSLTEGLKHCQGQEMIISVQESIHRA